MATKHNHPLYIDMITTAITEIKDRKGANKQAIMKYINANYDVGDKASSMVRNKIKSYLDSGKLILASGNGAAGRFRLPAAASQKKEKPTKKSKNVVSKKKSPTKKSTPKKSAPAKPVVAQKKATPKKKVVMKSKKPASKKKTPAKRAKGTKRSKK